MDSVLKELHCVKFTDAFQVDSLHEGPEFTARPSVFKKNPVFSRQSVRSVKNSDKLAFYALSLASQLF